MKIQKTISVDYEAWEELKKKTDNCSSTINEMILVYNNTTETKNEEDSLKVQVIKLQAEISKKNEELKKAEEERLKAIPKFKWGRTEF